MLIPNLYKKEGVHMKKTMKCVIKAAPKKGCLSFVERPIPRPGPNDVLIKVHAVAICGTDVHISEWAPFASDRMKPPCIIGHEFSGEVVERGKLVEGVEIGDHVSAETHLVCHMCEPCRNNDFHVCSHTKTIGLSRHGALAEYIVIPAENAVVFDKSVPWEILSLMEPYIAAVHAVTTFSVSGRSVAIIGCGPIGAMAVGVAKACGAANVIALEPNEMRLKKGGEMGADAMINPIGKNLAEAVRAVNGGKPVDIVIDFSGNVQAIGQALTYIRPAGKIVILGLSERNLDIRLDSFVYSGLTLQGIAGRRMYTDWETGKGLLKAGLSLAPIITHVLPMTEYERGIELMKTGQCCKCVLTIP